MRRISPTLTQGCFKFIWLVGFTLIFQATACHSEFINGILSHLRCHLGEIVTSRHASQWYHISTAQGTRKLRHPDHSVLLGFLSLLLRLLVLVLKSIEVLKVRLICSISWVAAIV